VKIFLVENPTQEICHFILTASDKYFSFENTLQQGYFTETKGFDFA